MKKILAIIVSIAMVMSLMVVPAVAASDPTVTVETAAGTAKAGDTVTLAVSIANNPGFTNFEWHVVYDETKLELNDIQSTYYDEDEEDDISYISNALIVKNNEIISIKTNDIIKYLLFLFNIT